MILSDIPSLFLSIFVCVSYQIKSRISTTKYYYLFRALFYVMICFLSFDVIVDVFLPNSGAIFIFSFLRLIDVTLVNRLLQVIKKLDFGLYESY